MGVKFRSAISLANRLFTAWRITGSSPSKVSSQNRYSVLAQSPRITESCFFIPLEKVDNFLLLSREKDSRRPQALWTSKEG